MCSTCTAALPREESREEAEVGHKFKPLALTHRVSRALDVVPLECLPRRGDWFVDDAVELVDAFESLPLLL